nr:unnamed protein product [Callosobruchus analis]
MLNLGIRKLNNVNSLNSLVQLDALEKVDILQKSYADVFIEKMGTFNQFKVTLTLKDNEVPKFCKARPIPFSLKGKIENEMERLVNCGVPTDFSEWSSPIVPVLKPSGDIRI